MSSVICFKNLTTVIPFTRSPVFPCKRSILRQFYSLFSPKSVCLLARGGVFPSFPSLSLFSSCLGECKRSWPTPLEGEEAWPAFDSGSKKYTWKCNRVSSLTKQLHACLAVEFSFILARLCGSYVCQVCNLNMALS